MKKNIIIVVAIVIVVAVALFALGKGGLKNSAQKYASPQGLFTLEYPEGWTKSAEEEGAVTFTKGENERVSVTIDYEDIIYNLFTNGLKFEKGSDITVDGRTVKTYTTSEQVGSSTVYATMQVLPLNASSTLIVSVVGFDPKEGTEIVKSIDIDDTKIQAVTESVAKQVATAMTNAHEAQAISLIGSVKTAAEAQFTKAKSYVGFCKNDDTTQQVAKAFGEVGLSMSCKDAKAGYAVSAQLPSGKYYCVDGSGYSGEAKELNTGTTCLK